MEDLLKGIYKELVAIHNKLDSLESTIITYSSDNTAVEILDAIKEIKNKK